MRPSPRIRAKHHIIKARDPELAPRCPQCGYNLYGNKELRCPECGQRATFDEALWASDASRLDRRAVLLDRIFRLSGWPFIAGSILVWGLHVYAGRELRSFASIASVGLMVYWFFGVHREMSDVKSSTLLLVSTLSCVIALISWFFG